MDRARIEQELGRLRAVAVQQDSQGEALVAAHARLKLDRSATAGAIQMLEVLLAPPISPS
jgi:hypothetical protein